MQNLLQNRSSGNYYGRWTITVNGKSKQKWINLSTDVFSVAKLRVADEATKIEKLRSSSSAVVAGRITHHDFRHLFATRCIEAGVDIPKISRWMGQADGGALAMKIYGHLQREHSDLIGWRRR